MKVIFERDNRSYSTDPGGIEKLNINLAGKLIRMVTYETLL